MYYERPSQKSTRLVFTCYSTQIVAHWPDVRFRINLVAEHAARTHTRNGAVVWYGRRILIR